MRLLEVELATTLLLYYSTTLLLYYSTTLLLYYSTTLLLLCLLEVELVPRLTLARHRPPRLLGTLPLHPAVLGLG